MLRRRDEHVGSLREMLRLFRSLPHPSRLSLGRHRGDGGGGQAAEDCDTEHHQQARSEWRVKGG
jgi:hypothetical protein